MMIALYIVATIAWGLWIHAPALYVVLCIGVFSITHSIWQASQQRTQEHEELLEELRALRGPDDDDDE